MREQEQMVDCRKKEKEQMVDCRRSWQELTLQDQIPHTVFVEDLEVLFEVVPETDLLHSLVVTNPHNLAERMEHCNY